MRVTVSPLLAVQDVPASSAWYQELLGCTSDMEQGHPHRQEYDRVVDEEGRVLIGLHSWDDPTGTPVDRLFSGQSKLTPGRGVVMTFTVDDFEQAVGRALQMKAQLVGAVADYPDRSRSVLVQDPDGYHIALRGLGST